MKMGSRFGFYDFQMFTLCSAYILYNEIQIRKSIVITIVEQQGFFVQIGSAFRILSDSIVSKYAFHWKKHIKFDLKPKFTQPKTTERKKKSGKKFISFITFNCILDLEFEHRNEANIKHFINFEFNVYLMKMSTRSFNNIICRL